MTALARAILVVMVTLQPASTFGLTPAWAASYPATAQEIADAAESRPIARDSVRTAALGVVWAFRESRFNREAQHDDGAGLGLFGIHLKTSRDTSATGFVRLAHTSWKVCEQHPVGERMGWYAAGGNGCEKRLELSRARMREVERVAAQLRGILGL